MIIIIKNLHIKHFKSIDDINIECSKINVFIGEPNTGKTNILESIGFLSWLGFGNTTQTVLYDYIRYKYLYNLFYNNDVTKPFEIDYGDTIQVFFKDGMLNIKDNNGIDFSTNLNGGLIFNPGEPIQKFFENLQQFKFYKFKEFNNYTFTSKHAIITSYLLPPSGGNMITLLHTNKDIRSFFSSYVKKINLKLVIDPFDNQIEFQKELSDESIIKFPLETMSDTILRILSYMIAIISNENSIMIFDEPEAYAFPYYTKTLAEMISLDKTNQFFLTTHNPYMINPIIEKAQKKDLSIFVTYMDKDITKVKKMEESDIARIFNEKGGEGMDIFLNLDKFI
ncbi:MAG: AAA family ATPase [Thermoplasmata archaeon]